MNIFVAKLSASTTEKELNNLFSQYGEVISAKVIFDKTTGNSKRYGFVEMKNDEEANEAIKQLNDSEQDDSKIVVKKAAPKDEYKRQQKSKPFSKPYNKSNERTSNYKPNYKSNRE